MEGGPGISAGIAGVTVGDAVAGEGWVARPAAHGTAVGAGAVEVALGVGVGITADIGVIAGSASGEGPGDREPSSEGGVGDSGWGVARSSAPSTFRSTWLSRARSSGGSSARMRNRANPSATERAPLAHLDKERSDCGRMTTWRRDTGTAEPIQYLADSADSIQGEAYWLAGRDHAAP